MVPVTFFPSRATAKGGKAMIPRSLLGLALGLGLLWAAPAAAQQVRIFRPGRSVVGQYFRQAFYSIVPATIASGRVVPANQWPFQYNGQWPGGQTEQLHFQTNGGVGSVHYQRTTPQEQLTVEFSSDGRFVVRRSNPGKADKPMAELAQVAGQPLTFSAGSGGQADRLSSVQPVATAGDPARRLPKRTVAAVGTVPLVLANEPDLGRPGGGVVEAGGRGQDSRPAELGETGPAVGR